MTPTSIEDFEKVTPLIVEVVASNVLNDRNHNLTTQQQQWFVEYCDLWVRWLHANNTRWSQWLKGNDARDMVASFISHWLDAYELDPAGYQSENTKEQFV